MDQIKKAILDKHLSVADRILDSFEKAAALPIGTIKRRPNGNFIKTADGWKYHSSVNTSIEAKDSAPSSQSSTQNPPHSTQTVAGNVIATIKQDIAQGGDKAKRAIERFMSLYGQGKISQQQKDIILPAITQYNKDKATQSKPSASQQAIDSILSIYTKGSDRYRTVESILNTIKNDRGQVYQMLNKLNQSASGRLVITPGRATGLDVVEVSSSFYSRSDGDSGDRRTNTAFDNFEKQYDQYKGVTPIRYSTAVESSGGEKWDLTLDQIKQIAS